MNWLSGQIRNCFNVSTIQSPYHCLSLVTCASNVSYEVFKRPHFYIRPVAVLGKNIWGPGPSSFGRQQRLSEITIEPIKNWGAGQDLGTAVPPGPNIYRYWTCSSDHCQCLLHDAGVGIHAFCHAAPTIWNSLPADLTDNFNNKLLSGFKCSLKTYFYKLSFAT